MPIEISNHTLSLVKGSPESSPTRPPAPSPTTPAERDTVAITPAAGTLRALEQQLASLPVVDPQRVSQVRGVVDQPQESTNFRQMAEKIMSFESALNRART